MVSSPSNEREVTGAPAFVGAPLTPTFRSNDMKTVKFVVEGGVVQDVVCPKGVRVVIHDYDIDGIPEDELTTDKSGDDCIETIWE
jgi:hypothetical protein